MSFITASSSKNCFFTDLRSKFFFHLLKLWFKSKFFFKERNKFILFLWDTTFFIQLKFNRKTNARTPFIFQHTPSLIVFVLYFNDYTDNHKKKLTLCLMKHLSYITKILSKNTVIHQFLSTFYILLVKT